MPERTTTTTQTGEFDLSSRHGRFDNLERFKQLVQRADSNLESYWDFKKRRCDIDRLDHDIKLMDGETRTCAEFLFTIWSGNMPFDFVENIHTLERKAKTIIQEWSEHPFFM